jgi:hypothetical protein
MTPSGIDPVTFRFVVQCLNHCPTAMHRSPSETLSNRFPLTLYSSLATNDTAKLHKHTESWCERSVFLTSPSDYISRDYDLCSRNVLWLSDSDGAKRPRIAHCSDGKGVQTLHRFHRHRSRTAPAISYATACTGTYFKSGVLSST